MFRKLRLSSRVSQTVAMHRVTCKVCGREEVISISQQDINTLRMNDDSMFIKKGSKHLGSGSHEDHVFVVLFDEEGGFVRAYTSTLEGKTGSSEEKKKPAFEDWFGNFVTKSQ